MSVLPTRIKVYSPDGAKFLNYARQKLAYLEKYRLDNGLPSIAWGPKLIGPVYITVVASELSNKIEITDAPPRGFISHPRTNDVFTVQRYGYGIYDDRRGYLIAGGWKPAPGGELEEIESEMFFPSSDLDEASFLIRYKGDSVVPSGKFLGKRSMYGNFYLVHPQNQNRIISWHSTPTRHGAIVHGDVTISGLPNNDESPAFSPYIYRNGNLYIKGPKCNEYESPTRGRNEYALILGCGWREIEYEWHLLAVASYAANGDYWISVWSTSGRPSDGQLYDADTRPGGWRERGRWSGGNYHLPWWFSDNGVIAVCSDGSTIDLADIKNPAYGMAAPSVGSLSISQSESGRKEWTISYSNDNALCESGAIGLIGLPHHVTGTLVCGAKLADVDIHRDDHIDVHGNYPDTANIVSLGNKRYGLELLYNGEPWSSGGCPYTINWSLGCAGDMTYEDETTHARVHVDLDRVCNAEDTTCTLSASTMGVSASIELPVPAKPGYWQKTSYQTGVGFSPTFDFLFPDVGLPSAGAPIFYVSISPYTIEYEHRSTIGCASRSPDTCPPGGVLDSCANGAGGKCLELRDCNNTGESTQMCNNGVDDPFWYTTTGYTCQCVKAKATYTWVCL